MANGIQYNQDCERNPKRIFAEKKKMRDRLFILLTVLATAGSAFSCQSTNERSCPAGPDAGASDSRIGPEAKPCSQDDLYFFGISGHMSADRSITFQSVGVYPGWLAGGESREVVGRLLSEDGILLGEHGYSDFMLCSGDHCPPLPHELDFQVAIKMVAGAASYELTDTISGNPPVRLDLRGHVQLFCMNQPCQLDVCSTDVADRDGAVPPGP
jgi:hypothetical protein